MSTTKERLRAHERLMSGDIIVMSTNACTWIIDRMGGGYSCSPKVNVSNAIAIVVYHKLRFDGTTGNYVLVVAGDILGHVRRYDVKCKL